MMTFSTEEWRWGAMAPGMQENGVKMILEGSHCGVCENIHKAGTCLEKQPFYLNMAKSLFEKR